MDGNLILGVLGIQSVLIFWMLGLQLANNNKLTKHCAVSEAKDKKLQILERMHNICDDDLRSIQHPPVLADEKR